MTQLGVPGINTITGLLICDITYDFINTQVIQLDKAADDKLASVNVEVDKLPTQAYYQLVRDRAESVYESEGLTWY